MPQASESIIDQSTETVIVGGGQAGLATSYFLKQHNRSHMILEQADRPANAWRNDRWDSFTLVIPNWAVSLPGAEYDGGDPDGFLNREEIIAYLENYIDRYQLPIRCGERVVSIESFKGEFLVTTEKDRIQARNVVIATGFSQTPRIPAFSARISPAVTQLHSGHYRNPQSLPPGAVLVVGSGQSGSQIAEELYQNGRKVYLCVGKAGRVPRCYRGMDVARWLALVGFFDRSVEQLPSPHARFAGNPHLTGKDGGHTINLHQFARDGVTLLGHLTGADGSRLHLAEDLNESLEVVDRVEAELVKMIDEYIAKSGNPAPPEILPELRNGYAIKEIQELDLTAAGITTMIWAIGYRFDFSLVRLPVFDDSGFPLQNSGITGHPGLYFVGLPWMDSQKSGLLLGVGENANKVTADLVQRMETSPA